VKKSFLLGIDREGMGSVETLWTEYRGDSEIESCGTGSSSGAVMPGKVVSGCLVQGRIVLYPNLHPPTHGRIEDTV
jgi:hypothetical protein